MSDLVKEPVQGPEILGPRLTVYHLLTSFLNPEMTEVDICRIYRLTAQQVAAARAYILTNPETVLAQHLKIEERLAVGNPPEVRAEAERAKSTFMSFKKWFVERQKAADLEEGEMDGPPLLPAFKEWLATQGRD